MRNSPYSFVVLKAHDHRYDSNIIKGIKTCWEDFTQELKKLFKSKLLIQPSNDLFNLRYVEETFEKPEKFAGVKYFLINREVVIEFLWLISLFEPRQEDGQVLTAFEEAFLM